jgi:hypothetical protein
MQIASGMAETAESEPGAPVPKDQIDPEMVKLSRTRAKIGVVTAAGMVFLCGLFLLRINPDRKFGGAGAPEKVAVADVVDGKIGAESYISIDGTAEPLMAHAIRATTAKGTQGLRVVPLRGTGDRMWLVITGDGWDQPQLKGYTGRLRKLGDLSIAATVNAYADSHPMPVFATADATRAGAATGQVATVTGETVTVHDADRVAFDRADRDAAVIVVTFNDKLPSAAAWSTALATAGIEIHGQWRTIGELTRFDVAMPDAVAALTDKLAKANLWAARIEPVVHHDETTWSAFKSAPPANADLVGLYVTHAIPGDAYALITNEKPEDYWYVMPVTVVVAVIGLLFAWALVRAVKRDVLQA